MKTAIAASAVLMLIAISTLRCACAHDPSPPASPATSGSLGLDGTASCEVKQLSKDHWRGRFTGQWQQMPFDYAVEFRVDDGAKHTRLVAAETKAAKPGQVSIAGKAVIDGAPYQFLGQLGMREFTIQFTSDRYEGAVLLKRVQAKSLPPTSGQ